MTKDTPLRAAVYARVSTHNQKEGESLDDQVTRCRARAVSNKWTVADDAVYVEDITGSTHLAARPEGGRLLADVRQGKIQVIIVTKVDRFTRSLRHGSDAINSLQEQGVAFVSLAEDFDTTKLAGRLMLNLLMVFADFERGRIAERTSEGKLAAINKSFNAEGKATRWAIGAGLPFGYTTTEEGLIVEDAETAHAVRRIFEMRAAGLTTPELIKVLTAEGLRMPPRRTSKTEGLKVPRDFSPQTVMSVLRREAYKGEGIPRVIGGHARKLCKAKGDRRHDCPKCLDGEALERATVIFDAPALVTPKLWAAANRPFKGGRSMPKRGGEKVNTYALGGRIKHAEADGRVVPMIGTVRTAGLYGGGKGLVRFYRCGASSKPNEHGGGCTNFGTWAVNNSKVTAVRANVVEAAVLLWALDLAADDEKLKAYVAEADAAVLAATGSDDVRVARERLAAIEVSRARLLDLFETPGSTFTKADYLERDSKLSTEASALGETIERANAAEANAMGLKLTIEDLMNVKVLDKAPEGWRDPNADDSMTEGDYRRDIARTLAKGDKYSRTPELPEATIAEVARLARLLDIEVVLHANEDNPQRPRFSVTSAAVDRLAAGIAPNDSMYRHIYGSTVI